MNNDYLFPLIKHYQLGNMVIGCQLLGDTYQHTCWKLQTEQGAFFIKEFCLPTFSGINTVEAISHTEEIAAAFARQGISIVAAINRDQQCILTLNNKSFAVYPWIDAIKQMTLQPEQAYCLGELLARLHKVKIGPLPPKKKKYEANEQYWEDLIHRSSEAAWHQLLQSSLLNLITWNQQYQQAQTLCDRDLIVSHCDLNLGNILWQDGNPILIDWESVGLINPAIELYNLALNCSGIIDSDFNQVSYQAVFEGYQQASGRLPRIDEQVIHAGLGSWLAWISFQAERALDSDDPAIHQTAFFNIESSVKVLEMIEQTIVPLSRWRERG